MEENNANSVSDTVRVFDLQVGQQMLPNGSNPLGSGLAMKNLERGLSMEDVPRIFIGEVQGNGFETEHGNEIVFEKLERHGTGFVRSDDEELQETGLSNEEMKKRWEELR